MGTRNNKLINFILEFSQIILVYLGIVSVLLCTATSLELTFDKTVFILILLFASILFYGLFSVLETFKNGKLYGLLGLALFGAAVVIRFFASVKKGFIIIINGFLKEFMNFTGSNLTLLANSTDGAGVKFCTSMVLILVGIYLIAIVSAFFYRRRRSSVFLVATIPFMIIPLIVGRLGYFAHVFTYLIVAASIVGTRHLRTDATDRRMRQKLSIVLMLVGLFAGAVSWIVVPPSRYEDNSGKIIQAKNSMVALTTWSQEDVFTWFKAYFNDDAIDYGKIGKKGEIHYNGDVMLKISGNVNENHGLYLKGYVGDIYAKNKWKSLAKDEQYQKDLVPLTKSGINPDNWHMQLRNELGEKETSGTSDLWQTGTLRVRNLAFGYGNYVVPYLPTSAFKSETNGRIAIDVPGIDYTVEYFALYPYVMRRDLVSGNKTIADAMFWEGNKTEREMMKSFVEKYYLDIPDTVQSVCDDFKQYLTDNGGLYDKLKNGDDVQSKILAAVKTYISQDTEYTLSPGKTPSKKEAVEYFLKENKKGYCTYYATAAAILLRSVGIPTRYVEGMYVSKEELSTSVEDSSEVEVKDHDAHAWVEVFDEKYGFVPFEVTPGVGEDDFSTPNNSSSDKSKDSNSSDSKEEEEPEQKDEPKEEPDQATPTPIVTQEPEESMIFEDIDTQEESDADNQENQVWKIIVEILVGIVIFLLIAEGQRRLRRYFYKRSLFAKKISRRIRRQHYHLAPVLVKKGAVYRGQSVAEYAEQISMNIHVTEANVYEYVAAVYRARFGPDDFTEEEYSEFQAIYEQMIRQLYDEAKVFGKLYYMYIMVL